MLSRDRRFQFLVSPITTNAVDVSVFVQLADKVASRVQKEGFEKELAGIVVFPIVANAAVYTRENFVVHKRSDNAYYVGKNLDFETWRRARKAGRLKLAVKNIEDSVLAVPEKHFGVQAKMRLLAIVRDAATER